MRKTVGIYAVGPSAVAPLSRSTMYVQFPRVFPRGRIANFLGILEVGVSGGKIVGRVERFWSWNKLKPVFADANVERLRDRARKTWDALALASKENLVTDRDLPILVEDAPGIRARLNMDTIVSELLDTLAGKRPGRFQLTDEQSAVVAANRDAFALPTAKLDQFFNHSDTAQIMNNFMIGGHVQAGGVRLLPARWLTHVVDTDRFGVITRDTRMWNILDADEHLRTGPYDVAMFNPQAGNRQENSSRSALIPAELAEQLVKDDDGASEDMAALNDDTPVDSEEEATVDITTDK